MPCYLFTFHAHGTWMPDKAKGYVHRTQGLQAKDDVMASRYRANQKQPTINFSEKQLGVIVASLCDAGSHLNATIHAIATDTTHFHVLVSWGHGRKWDTIRRSIRTAVSLKLNQQYGKRVWLAKNSSRKQVKDDDHFFHLISKYLPSHRGIFFLRDEDRKRLPGIA